MWVLARQDQKLIQTAEPEGIAQIQPHLLIEVNMDGSALTFDELEKIYRR